MARSPLSTSNEPLRSEEEEVFVDLSPQELSERGAELANTQMKLQELEQLAEEFKLSHKAKKGPLETERSALARAIFHKREPRFIKVNQVPDYDADQLHYVRADNGEVIRSRRLKVEERQERFALKGSSRRSSAESDA